MQAGVVVGLVAPHLDLGEGLRPADRGVEDVFDRGGDDVHVVGLRAFGLDARGAFDRDPGSGILGVVQDVRGLRLGRVVERILRVAQVPDLELGHEPGHAGVLFVFVEPGRRNDDFRAGGVLVSVIGEGAVEERGRPRSPVGSGVAANALVVAKEDRPPETRELDGRRVGEQRGREECEEEEGDFRFHGVAPTAQVPRVSFPSRSNGPMRRSARRACRRRRGYRGSWRRR